MNIRERNPQGTLTPTVTAELMERFDELRNFGHPEASAKIGACTRVALKHDLRLQLTKDTLTAALKARKAGGHSMTAALL